MTGIEARLVVTIGRQIGIHQRIESAENATVA